MKMEIIDNFLSDGIHQSFLDMFSRVEFPWYWNDEKACEEYTPQIETIPLCDPIQNHQFIHAFYLNHKTNSNWNIDPLIKKLNPAAIIRVKANLNVRENKILRYGFHIDTKYDSKTAIYYLNSNNGYTLFADGTKVESIANRIVIFNSLTPHTGTTCTDVKRRMVINLNYF
jgi:hypothetical protein